MLFWASTSFFIPGEEAFGALMNVVLGFFYQKLFYRRRGFTFSTQLQQNRFDECRGFLPV